MKKMVLFLLITLAISAVGVAPVSAVDIQEYPQWRDRLAQVDEYMMEQLKQNQVLGSIYGVIHQDRLVHSYGFGTVSKGEQVSPSDQTVFSIASVTKTFTS